MRGEKYDEKADVYSFGLLLLDLAAGEGLPTLLLRRFACHPSEIARNGGSSSGGGGAAAVAHGDEVQRRAARLFRAVQACCLGEWRPVGRPRGTTSLTSTAAATAATAAGAAASVGASGAGGGASAAATVAEATVAEAARNGEWSVAAAAAALQAPRALMSLVVACCAHDPTERPPFARCKRLRLRALAFKSLCGGLLTRRVVPRCSQAQSTFAVLLE